VPGHSSPLEKPPQIFIPGEREEGEERPYNRQGIVAGEDVVRYPSELKEAWLKMKPPGILEKVEEIP
jgi:hypothetical protein